MSNTLAETKSLKYRGIEYCNQQIKPMISNQHIEVKYRGVSYKKKIQSVPVMEKLVLLKYRGNSYGYQGSVANLEKDLVDPVNKRKVFTNKIGGQISISN
ncbi:MAG: DUF4278 domain-containing protein [Cyanobacteria bacterium P01_F01_bin.143]